MTKEIIISASEYFLEPVYNLDEKASSFCFKYNF